MRDTAKSRAEANYETWHQKHVNKIIEKRYEFPKQVFCVGKAVHIMYHSDKWEDEGKGFDYSHYFDSMPSVYKANPAMGSPKSVRNLLKADPDGELPLPILAGVLEITINDGVRDQKTKFESHKPLMCCSDDRKTLIIFAKSGPIFIRGGSMVVTERGIVK